MNEAKPSDHSDTKTEKKSGFFKRMVEKLDDTMKQKADKAGKQENGCGGNNSKGGKCC